MADDRIHVASLTDLPNDVFVAIFQYCSLSSFCALSLTCRTLNDLVTSIGYPMHQRMREQRGISWVPVCINDVSSWSPLARLRHDALTARNLRACNYTKRTLTADPWSGNHRPLIALGPARIRMVVGSGSKLYVYKFEACSVGDGAPEARLEGTYTVGSPGMRLRDLRNANTSLGEFVIMECLAFLPDGGEDRTLLVGFTDTYVMQVKLPEHPTSVDAAAKVEIHAAYRHRDIVESISVYDDFVFSLSGPQGRGVLSKFSSESGFNFFSPQTFEPTKGGSWSLLLPSFSSNAPHLAIGARMGWIARPAPLSLYALVEGSSAMSAEPTMILGMPDGQLGSSVISLAPAPPEFPGAHSGTVLASGWVDGCVRVYDVRVPSVGRHEHGGISMPVLPPVLTLSEEENEDSDSDDYYDPSDGTFPIATGGPVGTTIAASYFPPIVKLWDVRSPGAPVVTEDVDWVNDALKPAHNAWLPNVDPPPVYGLALAGSRCFGVTFYGPFELDFGGSRANGGATPLPVSA